MARISRIRTPTSAACRAARDDREQVRQVEISRVGERRLDPIRVGPCCAPWGAIEIKLGEGQVEQAAANRKRFAEQIDGERSGPPPFWPRSLHMLGRDAAAAGLLESV